MKVQPVGRAMAREPRCTGDAVEQALADEPLLDSASAAADNDTLAAARAAAAPRYEAVEFSS
jgi:hypothetical protein